jgi:hypothetical protein
MPTRRQKAAFVVILLLGFMLYAVVKLEITRLGFEHQSYVKEKRQLLDEDKLLRIEYAKALLPSNIEHELKEKHGFIKAEEKHFRRKE